MTRRDFLLALLAGCLVMSPRPVLASDDGGGDGGGSDGGGSDGGSDGGGSDDGGSDDGGSDGGGSDAGGDDSGGGAGTSDSDDSNALIARRAVSSGSAASLKDVLRVVKSRYGGEVIHVGLSGSGRNLVYVIRLLDSQSRRLEVQVRAATSKIIGARFI